jgi:hypothetical protein
MENGATITGGSAQTGGGVLVFEGMFTMSGGMMAGNTGSGSFQSGGGVCVWGGTFNMSSGTIAGNEVIGYGGGVCVLDGTFNMSGGTIEENIAYASGGKGGGGVYVDGMTYSNGKFNMSGGMIQKNTGYVVGGVGLSAGSTFTMSGNSTIAENGAVLDGGGVYVQSGTFIKIGGTIYGIDAVPQGLENIATNAGAALYVYLSDPKIREKTVTAAQKLSVNTTDNTDKWVDDWGTVSGEQ